MRHWAPDLVSLAEPASFYEYLVRAEEEPSRGLPHWTGFAFPDRELYLLPDRGMSPELERAIVQARRDPDMRVLADWAERRAAGDPSPHGH